jgi:hypothetical protein
VTILHLELTEALKGIAATLNSISSSLLDTQLMQRQDFFEALLI